VVNSAETIALRFGLSETLVGLTVCSIGTSLPELVTSVVAARKNQAGMALGNVIGSNIFNILLVAGLASSISPIAVTAQNLIDIVILIVISLYMMLLVWKKQLLSRVGGASLLVIYVVYMIYICTR
jgi:cation:H+ antiporter